jgi:hypothetical protein
LHSLIEMSFEETVSLFSDSLRSCSSSLWRQDVQLEEAMFGLEWSWKSGSFYMEAECYFQEFSHEMHESGSLVERLVDGLTEFLQYHVALPISNIQTKTFYASTSPNSELRGGCFTSSRWVWDPGIMFSFSWVQLAECQVLMELLEDKQSLGREDCHVPIFGFPYYAVRVTSGGLSQQSLT